MKKYIDVVLPLPVTNYYTYLLPDRLNGKIDIGYRVIVPFGPKKFYTAVVVRIHSCFSEKYKVKEIVEILDERPVLFPIQLLFWEWIASYYLCSAGEVYKAALPSGLKLESETVVEYNVDFEYPHLLSVKEQSVVDSLSNDPIQSVKRLEKATGLKNVLPVIKMLLEKGAVSINEEVKGNYKPKVEVRVRLTEEACSEERLKGIFQDLTKAPKQLALLMKYLELSAYGNGKEMHEVSKKELVAKAGTTYSVLNSLIEKRILKIYQSEIGRLKEEVVFENSSASLNHNLLNEYQKNALGSILDIFKEKNVCLLHGVTSSGKTEVYIHLIKEIIKEEKQILYLLPEIALTTQITARLKRVFGSKLGIYHSKFSDAERVEIWQKQLSEAPYEIILGTRSSIFLPFHRLGLIIVDEEHEVTYKQQDPAPRYHARNAAIMLASMHEAKTLLGTATPSIETYFNASAGKYGLVELKERYQDIKLPEVQVVDIKELLRKKRMKGQFSPVLLASVRQALARKEQVILFQNRRGFAPMIECKTCGWVPKCKNCDVSLTYHKKSNLLTCHYCGYAYEIPSTCPACEEKELVSRGFGTERVEEELKCILPAAKIARMDLDTAHTRLTYERIINEFENHRTDILIGTQMVSKGLDFDHVAVVGILNADTILNYPDFRSYERAYQLMTQVAGRAGRKNKRGLVILQTKSIDLPIIHQVMENDYGQMYADQLAERKLFRYPPFYRLVYVYLKSKDAVLLDVWARKMADKLKNVFGDRILGPDQPPVARVQTYFIKKIIIKIEVKASMHKVREYLLLIQKEMSINESFRSLTVYYDVDPV